MGTLRIVLTIVFGVLACGALYVALVARRLRTPDVSGNMDASICLGVAAFLFGIALFFFFR